jgi:hypothetical protein
MRSVAGKSEVIVMKRLLIASISIGLFLSVACGQSKPRNAQSGANSAKLTALETAYQSGILSKEEYEAKKRELMHAAQPVQAPPSARVEPDPVQLSALETAYQSGILSKEEYEAKKRDLTQAASSQPSQPQAAAKVQVDPVQLSALETAYQSGVLSKEEFDIKRRELEQGAVPQASQQASPPASQPAQIAGTQSGWTRHRDPHGFDIEYPAGWTAEVSNDMRIVVRSQDGLSMATIAPFVRGGATCRQYLAEALTGTASIFPQARIENATQRRQEPDEVVAGFTFAGGKSRGAALCSLYRGSGMMFAIAAPSAQYERQKDDLVRIVRTVSFGQAGGPSSGQQAPARRPVQYARFTDPREGSFTLDVPAGWRAEGGLLRRSAIDVTASVRMSSPDGASAIFIGDERLFNCVTPEVMSGAMREGQMYDSGAGTRLMVLRFQPPITFAMNYLGQLQSMYGLSGIQVKDRRDRPDLTAASNRSAAQYNANPLGASRTLAGEVSFTAQRNGRQVAGYLLVSITAVPWMNNGTYWTPVVAGYTTPMEELGQTTAMFWHSATSAQVNPQWTQGQQKTTMATSQIFAASAAATNETITKSYWSTQATYDKTFQSDSDARRGQVRLRDPNTGEEFTSTAGHNYYYRPAAGDERHIFGTDNTDRPNIDATELLIVR